MAPSLFGGASSWGKEGNSKPAKTNGIMDLLAPIPAQTQGKIERWHQTLKNRILLENYSLPGDLKAQIAAFVGHYSHRRHHASLDNMASTDVYTGRGHTILLKQETTKRKTMKLRRMQHAKSAA